MVTLLSQTRWLRPKEVSDSSKAGWEMKYEPKLMWSSDVAFLCSTTNIWTCVNFLPLALVYFVLPGGDVPFSADFLTTAAHNGCSHSVALIARIIPSQWWWSCMHCSSSWQLLRMLSIGLCASPQISWILCTHSNGRESERSGIVEGVGARETLAFPRYLMIYLCDFWISFAS